MPTLFMQLKNLYCLINKTTITNLIINCAINAMRILCMSMNIIIIIYEFSFSFIVNI